MPLPALAVEHRWQCPNCDQEHVTRGNGPGMPFHNCAGLKGLSVPFVAAGVKAKVETVERGDWVGQEVLTYDDDNRPIMAAITTRDDGQDCAVYAPMARGSAED